MDPGPRLLFYKLGLFSLPFLLAALCILIVDPFNFAALTSVVPNEVKMRSAFPLHQPLWKLIEYHRSPKAHIILGDSRMGIFKEPLLTGLIGEPAANLSYGGGSLAEAVDSFWLAVNTTRLRSVTIGVNFEAYNDYASFRRTADYQAIRSNPLMYFVSRTVVTATGITLYAAATGVDPKIGVPTMRREEFWREVLDGPSTRRTLDNFARPRLYREELAKLANYCRANRILLKFVIMPTHADFRKRISAAKLERDFVRMRDELASIAPTLDFDYENQLTSDRNQFDDPVHLKGEWAPVLAREIWGEGKGYARIVPAPNGAASCHPESWKAAANGSRVANALDMP